jgi:hypothetical protein
MTRTAKKMPEDSDAITRLVNEILKEQRKIDRCEGDVVASHIRLGRYLAQLRPLATRNWAAQLKAVGMSSRVASRHLMIAQRWGKEIGLLESDLLPRLPTDLLKLEWLCRLSQDQLRNLLDKLDCKKAPRPQVIALVREALGELPPTNDVPDEKQFVRRFSSQLTRTIGRLYEMFTETEQQDRIIQLLIAEVRQFQDAIGDQPPPCTGS